VWPAAVVTCSAVRTLNGSAWYGGRQHGVTGVQQSWMQLPRNHVLPFCWGVQRDRKIDHRLCMHILSIGAASRSGRGKHTMHCIA
jgi:hypothetical protein